MSAPKSVVPPGSDYRGNFACYSFTPPTTRAVAREMPLDVLFEIRPVLRDRALAAATQVDIPMLIGHGIGMVHHSGDLDRIGRADEDKATLHELADKYGVSAERIRQIESNALVKLRTLMAPAA